MTFNFDLNDYQDSPYISQELVIADILMSRGLVELEEGERIMTPVIGKLHMFSWRKWLMRDYPNMSTLTLI
jgi:hypothetical protein